MTNVALLSILQGVAEFLPISSSGHLVLGKGLLGMGEMGIRLDVFLHVGTLVAVFAFYRATVGRLVVGCLRRDGEAWSYLGKIALSAVPAGLVGLLFKDALESAFASPRAVGVALMLTGVVLTATRFLPTGMTSVSWWKALLMGIAQAVAILPGVSRSGMTLAAARAASVDSSRAAEFSFLMSAPPIAGAAFLEILKAGAAVGDAAAVEVGWGACLFGAVVSGVVGYFSLMLLVKSLKGRWFWLFGPYCCAGGLLVVILV